VAGGSTGPDGGFALTLAADLPARLVRVVTCGAGEPITVFGRLGPLGRAYQRLGTVRLGAGAAGPAVFAMDVLAANVDWVELGRLAAGGGVARINDLLALVQDPALVPDQAVCAGAVADLEAESRAWNLRPRLWDTLGA
jgi:hypothetical protein